MFRLSMLTVLKFALLPALAQADTLDQPAYMQTLTAGIVCKSIDASIEAFDWAADHPHAQYVDLEANPDCMFISSSINVMVKPIQLHENDVAKVVIGQATPANSDTRYIWVKYELKQPEVDA